jgi:hypothetical protein
MFYYLFFFFLIPNWIDANDMWQECSPTFYSLGTLRGPGDRKSLQRDHVFWAAHWIEVSCHRRAQRDRVDSFAPWNYSTENYCVALSECVHLCGLCVPVCRCVCMYLWLWDISLSLGKQRMQLETGSSQILGSVSCSFWLYRMTLCWTLTHSACQLLQYARSKGY